MADKYFTTKLGTKMDASDNAGMEIPCRMVQQLTPMD
jgi:hypothetical protein